MTHIQQRRGTTAEWAAANPVLFDGEIGWERDTLRGKLGDGVTAWNDLDYLNIAPPVTSVAGRVGDITLSVADVAGAAPKASPAFTGNPTAPTPLVTDDDTSIATTGFVKDVLEASPVLGGTPTATTPPSADDSAKIATTEWVRDLPFAPLASPTFTGVPKAPLPGASDYSDRIPTTEWVTDLVNYYTFTPWEDFALPFFGTGVAPSIGNGNFNLKYRYNGDMVDVELDITMGSTTTYGDGFFMFGLPVPAAASVGGLAGWVICGNAGVSSHIALPALVGQSRFELIIPNGGMGAITSTSPGQPFSWGAGDYIRGTFSYRPVA